MSIFSRFKKQKIQESKAPKEPKAVGSSQRRPKTVKRISENIFATGDDLDVGTEFSDIFFKQLTGITDIDLPDQTLFRAQRLSILLFRKNARAWSGTEIFKDFALGDGVKYKAEDDKVQELLDKHWLINEWKDKIEERMRGLALFGEQVYPTFINEETGIVKLSSISPFRIKGIARNPKDAEELVSVVTKIKGLDPLEIIRVNDEGKLQGEVFYFAVNRISGGSRGVPDMLPSVDWLEGLDGMLFALMERSSLSQDIVFDLEYKGANANECREMALDFIQSLKEGGAYAHNEKVKLQIMSPDLAASEAETVISILLRQIQSGMRLAGLFFGDAEDLTKGSASELSIPVAKAIRARQNFWKKSLEKIFEFQIQTAQRLGKLEGVTNFGFKISMAPILLRDVATITKALIDLSTTLADGLELNFISEKEGAEIYRNVLEQLGALMEDFNAEDFRDLDKVMNRFGKKKDNDESDKGDAEE